MGGLIDLTAKQYINHFYPNFPQPEIAIVVGSGFSEIVKMVTESITIPYSELLGIPVSSNRIPGHRGELILGKIGNKSVAVFNGRVHMYQGVSALEAAFPSRIAAGLGCSKIILTSAVGSLNKEHKVGNVLIASDHINLMGDSPLVKWNGGDHKNPFIPLNNVYSDKMRAAFLVEARKFNLICYSGVYVGLLGPNYETPAEAKMLSFLGGDVAGMSTVPEAIVARALNIDVLSVSLITNVAAGKNISHEEVIEIGKQSTKVLSKCLEAFVRNL